MRLLAPAKINLHLRIGPSREDGFHPLMSWFCTVGLFDELEFEIGDGIELTCDDPKIPSDERNLVVKAANLFRPFARRSVSNLLRPFARHGVSIKLTKRIPAGGGLGGGSSDGATALMALNQLWELNWPVRRLSPLAAKLGSDVSFFLHQPSAVCTGVGENVNPIAPPAAKWAVLILPAFGMETAKVYQQFDRMGLGHERDIATQPDWSEWAKLRAKELLPLLVNDLATPAFEMSPELRELRDECQRRLDRPVCLSGSGSTLFTLYDVELEARVAAEVVGGQCVEVAPKLA
jgi:4-diphosphocytidyl-2-C-methyl-D-erythritol kinase